VYTDTLGEWTVKFLLGRALPDEEAERASEGWRGDRIAFGVANGKMGYFWRVRFDDPDAAARFEATLKKARSVKPTGSAETIKREGRDVVVTSP
jgi:hypothetical protein